MSKTGDQMLVRFGVPESFAMAGTGWLLGTLVWLLAAWESPLHAWRSPEFWLLCLIATLVATVLCSAIPQAKLTADGISALDTLCLPRTAQWSDVTRVREFSVAGLCWLLLYRNDTRYALWLPFFRSGRAQVLEFLSRHVHAGPVSGWAQEHLARSASARLF